MANVNTVLDLVAKEALRIAHEKATFIGTCNRSYDDSFGEAGAKGGANLRVRNPNQYTRRQGSRIMDVQDQQESTQTIVVATQDGVDMRFNSAELALEIDELSRRYIEPAMSVLMSGIDGDCLATAIKNTYNVVGTAGTMVGTVTSGFSDTSALGKARAALNQGLAPKDSNRAVQMDSITMASISNGIKGLFLPKAEVEKAWTDGYIGTSQMATFYENERTWTLTNGSDVTGTADSTALGTADADGSYSVITWASGAAIVPTVGAIFTLGSTGANTIYACHPETKMAYANGAAGSVALGQQFVITAVDSGNRKVTVSPAIFLSGAKQNVCKSDSTVLAASDFNSLQMNFLGSASTSYRQNLMYHRDAFAFVTADLPLMDSAEKCVRQQQDGFSIRVWQDADIRNDELLMRLDILYGFKVLRPAWACRITN